MARSPPEPGWKYAIGVQMTPCSRAERVRAAVRSGSDNAYGIYLSHMLVITTLTWAGWGKLSPVIPWPALCLATVVIVIASAAVLTGLLARTPLAVPLTGRAQVPWRRPRPRPLQSAAAAGDRDAMRDKVQPPLRAA